MADPQLVVMAAGIGSRYGGLKQIDPVGPSGEIVIDYAIYDAVKAGFSKVVFIINRKIEQAFKEKVGDTISKHIETAYVFQESGQLPEGFDVPPDRTKPWGTAHAVLCAKEAVDAPFAVINADDFYGAGAFKALSDYLRGAEDSDGVYDLCMVGYLIENTVTEHGHVARGVCTTKDGYLDTVVERTKIQIFGDAIRYTENDADWVDLPIGTIVSMNMWGLTPGVFAELEGRFPQFLANNINNPKAEYFLPSVVNDLLSEGKAKVKVLRTDEKWLGVTYQQDKPRVAEAIGELVKRGVYPERLW